MSRYGEILPACVNYSPETLFAPRCHLLAVPGRSCPASEEENAMSNIIEHPGAVEIARRMEWEAERASRAAREKAERAEHRKWLKETKPERDVERARQRGLDAARARLFGAASDAAWEVAEKAFWGIAYDEAYFAILDAAGLAAEAAAAKAAGYETWAAFQAAREAQVAADDAAYEEKQAAPHVA